MNDDFLHKHRQAPDKAFADDLYRQLQEENEDMTALPMTRTYARRVRFPLGAAALFAMLLVGVLLALRPNFTPPTLTQIDTGFLDTLQPITAENAGELTQIAQLGNGRAFDVDWHGDIIAVGGALGVWLYDSTHLTEEPRLLAGQQTMYARRVALTWSQMNPLVAAPDGNTIRVWNVETGAEVGVFSDGDDKHWDVVAISPDGRYLAGGESMLGYEVAQRWALNVWNVETGELVSSQWETEAILNLDFNPTRLYQLAVQSMSRVFVLSAEVTDPQIMAEFDTPDNNLNVGLDFSPNGESLALATETGAVIWNTVTGAIEQEIVISDELTPYITDVAFSVDGAYLAVASRNFGVNVWNVALQNWITEEPQQNDSFRDVSALAFNNVLEAPLLASVQFGSTLSLFSFRNGMTLTNQRDFTSPIMIADLNVDDRTAAAGGLDGVIHVWNLETGQERYAHDSQLALLSGELAFTPDGSLLAYSGTLGAVEAGVSGELNPGRATPTPAGGIHLISAADGTPIRDLGDSAKYFYLLAFSSDGETLAAYGANKANIQTWNWRESANLTPGTPLFNVNMSIDRLGFSPDGTFITLIDYDRKLRFFDGATGAESQLFGEPLPRSIDFAYSPDGTQIAVAQRLVNNISYVAVYDAVTGLLIVPLQYNTSTEVTNDLTFSPDGSLIAAIIDANRLHVWNAETGELLFDQGDSYISNNRLMFSRDGRMIITADWDGLIRVWGIPE